MAKHHSSGGGGGRGWICSLNESWLQGLRFIPCPTWELGREPSIAKGGRVRAGGKWAETRCWHHNECPWLSLPLLIYCTGMGGGAKQGHRKCVCPPPGDKAVGGRFPFPSHQPLLSRRGGARAREENWAAAERRWRAVALATGDLTTH